MRTEVRSLVVADSRNSGYWRTSMMTNLTMTEPGSALAGLYNTPAVPRKTEYAYRLFYRSP